MEQVNRNAFDNTSKPNTISPAPFAAIKNPMPIPAAAIVFFLVNLDLNSARKRKITWNIAQNMDISRSNVISFVHLLNAVFICKLFVHCHKSSIVNFIHVGRLIRKGFHISDTLFGTVPAVSRPEKRRWQP